MKKTTIIGSIVALIVIVGFAWFFVKDSSQKQQVSNLDVIDTVGNFYDQWLKAAQEPLSANPNRATLAKSPILSETLRDKLGNALKAAGTTTDPVLCQKVVPINISTRNIFQQKDRAQVLVTSRDKKVTEQAIVTLNKNSDGWYINDIQCSLGEFAPEREFSFEKEGFLLKTSIPKPYDPKNWHLIFTENGEQGHVVPLFFDATSQCTSLNGTKSVCKPEQFTEATKVSVHAQMSERGASVKQLEFIK
jgi:hypothetical protein